MEMHWSGIDDWKDAVKAARSYWNHVDCKRSCVQHYHCAPFGDASSQWALDSEALRSVNQMLDNQLLPYTMNHYCHRGPEEWEYACDTYEKWWQEEYWAPSIGFLMPANGVLHNHARFLRLIMRRDDLLVVVRSDNPIAYNFKPETVVQRWTERRAASKSDLQNATWKDPTETQDRGENLIAQPEILRRFFAVGCAAVGRAQAYEVFIQAKSLSQDRTEFIVYTFPRLMEIILLAWEQSYDGPPSALPPDTRRVTTSLPAI